MAYVISWQDWLISILGSKRFMFREWCLWLKLVGNYKRIWHINLPSYPDDYDDRDNHDGHDDHDHDEYDDQNLPSYPGSRSSHGGSRSLRVAGRTSRQLLIFSPLLLPLIAFHRRAHFLWFVVTMLLAMERFFSTVQEHVFLQVTRRNSREVVKFLSHHCWCW